MKYRIDEKHRWLIATVTLFVLALIYCLAVTAQSRGLIILGDINTERRMREELTKTVSAKNQEQGMVEYEEETVREDFSPPVHTNEKVRKVFERWSKCMRGQINNYKNDYKYIWNRVVPATTHCDERHLSKVRFTEFKSLHAGTIYHILPQEKDNVASNVLQLGINDDFTAEKALKNSLTSGSEFYGADSGSIDSTQYKEQVGAYFNASVANLQGSFDVIVYNGTGFERLRIPHIGAIDFMKNDVKQIFYDNLIIDSDLNEYRLTSMFHRQMQLDQNKITVCQANILFHWRVKENYYCQEGLRQFLTTLHAEARWSWHKAHRVKSTHVRIFFLNHEHPECVKRYIAPFY